MPVVESRVRVHVDTATAFAVSQTTGATRLRWDPFIRHQAFVDGAERPGKGVRTLTRHRLGWTMISEYVSFRPPTNVGMKMVSGPWFFANFAGGWRFVEVEPDAGRLTTPATDAVWRYSFQCRPRWLAPVAERVGSLVLRRDIDRRIAGFARACADPHVVAVARRAGAGPASS